MNPLSPQTGDLDRGFHGEIDKFFDDGCDDHVIGNIATIKFLLRRTLVQLVLYSTNELPQALDCG